MLFATSAPFAASRIKVAVFQVERGLQLMATIFLMAISSLCFFFYFIAQQRDCKQKVYGSYLAQLFFLRYNPIRNNSFCSFIWHTVPLQLKYNK